MDVLGATVEFYAGIEQRTGQIVMQMLRKILGQFDNETLTYQIVRNALTAVPVSYTHLDVYKRQITNRPKRFLLMALAPYPKWTIC